ncbi:MAG: LysR family transcriptional regulator [Betaproteobacteria bacterium TMED82]|nr:MAG: LysR family transcriptional regulator [Betaproteobacteria bacterium TMED82]
MTLIELRYVTAVARERHFGRAAESCFVSQPTLSVSIKKLEEELGTKIFERGRVEISVTDVGKEIIEQAQLILRETSKLKFIADQGRDPLLGSLKVGIIFTVGPYLLPLIMKKIISEVPSMPLVLYEDYTVSLLEKLKTGNIDIAILAEPFDTSGLNVMPIYTEDFVVAIPKSHPLKNAKKVVAEDLKQETLLLLGIGHCFRNQVLDVCPEAAKFSANAVGIQKTFEGSSLETIRHMVASGLGITLLPKMAISKEKINDSIKLINFKEPVPTRTVVIAWRRGFTRIKAVNKIRDLILSMELPGCKLNKCR